MKKLPTALAALACVLVFSFPAEAKKNKPAQDDQGQQKDENAESGAIPRYQPFPHNQSFTLTDINGKAPPKEIWLRIDSTGRATGSSGCKNFSGIFVIGPNRLGPRAMPAFTELTCDQSAQAYEREFWGILLSGPYWDTKGDDLIMKAFKGGGSMRFTRSM
ncbi:META domain-containing protein [Methylocystis heyeri]|uniref:META domain-containing protein n=1 Tax=Methylocystis heyeri TaxID=391905 RepID=A0A6B8KJV6_9HYPH|nr:META domain-containing protein [Methylocystis heyeri]QGM46890.1 META domain-containing protein [Methylocystis heyeri]